MKNFIFGIAVMFSIGCGNEIVPMGDSGIESDAIVPDSGIDASIEDCELDSDCEDMISCTVDSCQDGVCNYEPAHVACDDGNICTDDVCLPGIGCEAVNNEAGCDNDVYCDGRNVCEAGVCVAVGDPCLGDTICDESRNACVGCSDRSDCPADQFDVEVTSCDYQDMCDESASLFRTHIIYSCTDSVCTGSSHTVTDICTRETDC
jgi:hypothetical protein